MGEIQAIIRQITASVTFLPLLQDACTFDLLVRPPLWPTLFPLCPSSSDPFITFDHSTLMCWIWLRQIPRHVDRHGQR